MVLCRNVVCHCKIAHTSGPKAFFFFFYILIPLQTEYELVPFLSNASSEGILNFKIAAIFSLFEQYLSQNHSQPYFFLMIVTTYDCQNPLRTSLGSFCRIYKMAAKSKMAKWPPICEKMVWRAKDIYILSFF